MNVGRIIIYIMSVLLMVSIIGCGDDYSEGDEQADRAFDRMSVVEKQYYKRVQDIWGQHILQLLREAIRGREEKPSNDELPFGDIISVIRKVNDVQLVIKDGWEGSKRNKYSAAKFSSLDPTWWHALVQKSRGFKEEVFKPVRRLTVRESIPTSYPITRVEHLNLLPTKQKEVDMNLLLTLDEYDDLSMEISDCQAAKDYLKMIASGGRALTIKDRDDLMRKILACKTMQLSESFQD